MGPPLLIALVMPLDYPAPLCNRGPLSVNLVSAGSDPSPFSINASILHRSSTLFGALYIGSQGGPCDQP